MQQSNRNDWNVRFEVTFYGNDPNKGSFREIKEDNIVFNDEFDIENKLPFNNAANVEINFRNVVDRKTSDKDYFSANVANRVLGAGPESRLFSVIREEKGYAYGAYSG